MDVIRSSVARKNLDAVLDRVTDDVEYTIISRDNGKHAVVISLNSFNNLVRVAGFLKIPSADASSDALVPYAEFPDTGGVYRFALDQKETPVEVVQFSDVRKGLDAVLDRVTGEVEYLLIPRRNDKHAVLMSLGEFSCLMETAYVIGNPTNAAHLRASFEQSRGEGARAALPGG